MDRLCSACKQGLLRADVVLERLAVAGREFEAQLDAMTCPVCSEFEAQLDAMTCPVCSESWVELADLQRFEREVALVLARDGEPSGEAFGFMRKSLGLTRDALAELFQVTFETIKAWEVGERPLVLAMWVLLRRMIEEQNQGSTATRDQLTNKDQGRRVADAQPLKLGYLTTQPAL